MKFFCSRNIFVDRKATISKSLILALYNIASSVAKNDRPVAIGVTGERTVEYGGVEELKAKMLPTERVTGVNMIYTCRRNPTDDNLDIISVAWIAGSMLISCHSEDEVLGQATVEAIYDKTLALLKVPGIQILEGDPLESALKSLTRSVEGKSKDTPKKLNNVQNNSEKAAPHPNGANRAKNSPLYKQEWFWAAATAVIALAALIVAFLTFLAPK